MLSSSSLRLPLIVAFLLSLPVVAAAADASPACAGVTPGETWSNAAKAFAGEDLVTVASCIAPEKRPSVAFTLLPMAQSLLQLSSLVPQGATREEAEAQEKEAGDGAARIVEIMRRYGLPTTPDEAAALDDAARKKLIASLEYPGLIADLILYIEAFDEDTKQGRAGYFTGGDFETPLADLRIEGDHATGSAITVVKMVRSGGRWYLLPPN